MPCPVDTTLQFAKICGSVQEICPVGDPQNLRVTIDLVNPEGGALTDPTTDAFVVGGRIFDDLIIDSTDGCWCTCDLLVNTAADPAQSLQPNNTAYKITVRWGTTTVIDGLQFQLDADTIGNFTLDTNAECGDCINISDLVEIPVLPPAATFCDQVDACVTDLQAQADGNTAAIAALVDSDTVSVVTDNGDGTWTHDDGNGNTVVITDTNTFGTAVDNGDGTFTATFPDGTSITTSAAGTDTFGLLVDNTDGTYTWTPADGGAGFTIDTTETIVSGDAGNVIVAGGDDGAFISCEIIQDCVGAALGALDGITYDDAGNAITVNLLDADGNALTPTADGVYQLPASAGNDTSVVTDNGDGTWTHDDGTGTTVVIDTGSVAAPAADGSVTATFPNGDTITTIPDVGEATVTEPTDYTTAISAVDTAGTATSSTVLRRLDDCENNAIDPAAATFVTWEQLTTYNRGHHVPFVDSGDGCTPADIVDCPSGLTAITTSPIGDVWEWDGAAWIIKNVSAGMETDITSGPLPTLQGTDLDAFTPNAWNSFAVHSMQYTNNDCVDHMVEMYVTASVDLRVPQGNRWQFRLLDTAPDNFTYQPGSPADYTDTIGNNAGNSLDQHNFAKISEMLVVAPGATVDTTQSLEINPLIFVSAVNNRIIVNQFRISYRAWRVG